MATAESATAPDVGKPPYVPYETFKGFIESLNGTVVPKHIDRSMMGKLSGASQSHLLVALRFLGLVDGKEDESTSRLRSVVTAFGTTDWKTQMEGTFTTAYAPIIGDLDIATSSEKRLRDAFKLNGKVDGTMLDRALRFYLKGLKEAGVDVSPHVGQRKPRTQGQRRSTQGGGSKTPKDREGGQGDAGGSTHPPPSGETPVGKTPEGMVDFPIPMGTRSGLIRVPKGIVPADLAVIDAMVLVVKAMAQQNADGSVPK